MSIEKNTPNFLKHSGLSFTTVINQTIELIPDAAALGIYCYLASKPDDWIIREKDIQNRFSRGRDYIKEKVKILKNLNLIKVESVRDENGKITHWETTLLNHIPNQNTENPYCGVHQNTEKPHSGFTRRLENPPHTNKRNNTNKKIIKKASPVDKSISLPDWLSEASWEEFKTHRIAIKRPLTSLAESKAIAKLNFLRDLGNDPIEVLDQSIINGWSGLFEISSNKASKSFTDKRSQSGSRVVEGNLKNEPKSTVPEWGPGHPTWEANRKWEEEHGRVSSH